MLQDYKGSQAKDARERFKCQKRANKIVGHFKNKGLDNLNIVHQSLIIYTERSLSNFPQIANSTRFFRDPFAIS